LPPEGRGHRMCPSHRGGWWRLGARFGQSPRLEREAEANSRPSGTRANDLS
jgi:hypothetical protein